MKFYPYERGGGGRKSFSHAEGGGGTQSFEVVLTRELEVLAILIGGGGGGARKVSTFLQGGRKKFYPVSRGDAQSFGPVIFPFCSPPPPPDQSLSTHIATLTPHSDSSGHPVPNFWSS